MGLDPYGISSFLFNVNFFDFEFYKNGTKIDPDKVLVYPTLLIAKLKPKNHIILNAKFEIDIGKNIFECGQTYVALSRLKDISGLYLKSFDVNKIILIPIPK